MAERNSHAHQARLFIEDIYDALKGAVQALGGAKVVGELLWPTKSAEQARGDLLDCLNRNNARKFDAEEILAILKLAGEAGYHQAKHWIDSAAGYQPTLPLDPVVERDRLAESLDRAAENFAALTQQAKRLLDRDGTKNK